MHVPEFDLVQWGRKGQDSWCSKCLRQSLKGKDDVWAGEGGP